MCSVTMGRMGRGGALPGVSRHTTYLYCPKFSNFFKITSHSPCHFSPLSVLLSVLAVRTHGSVTSMWSSGCWPTSGRCERGSYRTVMMPCSTQWRLNVGCE